MARARSEGDVLLLGTGAVGGVIARHLAAHPAVGRLTLADRETARAESLARDLRGAPGSGRTAARLDVAIVDASDAAALGALLAGRTLVINAVLPRFNGRVMDAALAARCAYLDLAGGEEDQLLRHDAWAAAGCVALHAMGEDPGISNVLARRGSDLLDQVEAIRVRDGEFSTSDDLPLACLFSTETFLEEAVSPSRVFEDGAYRDLPPWSGREIYQFPPPVGAQPVYFMAHEEVDTLPRLIGKGVRQVDFKLAIPDEMQRQIAFLDHIGMTRRDAVRVEGASVRPLALLSAVLPQPADLGGRVRGAAIVLVEVEGRREERRTRHVFHAVMTHDEAFRRQRATATAWLTGTGGAAGALALLSGRVPGPGVWSPEQIEPGPLIALLAELGLKVEERSENLPG